jgi:phosphatidylinositol alpha-1,6-mannosyltransferase
MSQKKKEKVLLISSDFPPVAGGQSRYLYDLWSCLPPEDIVVLAPALEGALAVDAELACSVVRVSLPLGDGLWAKISKPLLLLRWALKMCRRYDIRAIHCGQVFSAGFAGYWCKKLRSVPYYLYVYGADLLEFKDRFLWGGLLGHILKASKRIVVISRFTADAVVACGVNEEHLEMVTPALDLDRFAAAPERMEARRQLGWEGRKIILTLARLVERKGHDMVIRALPKISAEVPNVEYVIGGDGPYRPALEKLAAECGVSDRVKFLGFVPEEDLLTLFGGADVFTMISRELTGGDVEGFGIVFLEANALGTAVLAGRSGGTSDAVEDGKSGLLVDPQNLEEISQALIRLLTDEAWCQSLGEQGRARVHAKFDRKTRAAQLWQNCR